LARGLVPVDLILLTMESITGTAALYCSCASVLVPELIASVTSRIACAQLGTGGNVVDAALERLVGGFLG